MVRALPVALFASVLLAPAARAQEADRLRVFLDCPGFCDQTHIRTELTWVDWVLDREAADLHVLITSRSTGGGGRSYELAFIGLGDEAGHDHTLGHTVSSDATEDVTREGLLRVIALGLTSYVESETVLSRLSVVHRPVPSEGEPDAPTEDPWNFWVFRLGLNSNLRGESTSKNTNWSGSVTASRVTEAWKLRLSARGNSRSVRFELPDTVVKETTSDWGVSGSAVRSVAERWSLGLLGEAGANTFSNEDFSWRLQPGVEYSFFPYSESSRRLLTAQYLVGAIHYDWEEETIFNQTEETRLQHVWVTRLELVQPWGQWWTQVRASQYLHDTSKYSVTIFGNMNVRLFRGFSVRTFASYSWIRDQLNISIQDPTEEQILLRQRQLATSFSYSMSIGITYQFGSIFNNVVNPRFGT